MTESGDYISREAALVYAPLPKHLREYQTQNLDDAWEDGYFCALDQIRSIPAADVRPVVRGVWVKNGWSIRCSICGYDMPFATRNFCPNCGACMEES